MRPHEIAEICRRRDDCRVSHKTVQRVLAEPPLPTVLGRRYPPYAQIAEPRQRRLAIIHLYFDGWNPKSIAGYLETTRTRVFDAGGYLRYKRWRIYGERGLAGTRGAVWLFGEVLTVGYEEEPLAQYRVQYAPEARPYLWAVDDLEWHAVMPLPPYQVHWAHPVPEEQARLFP